MESKKTEVGSTAVSYFDKGEGKTIVLIHGFAGSKLYWEKVLPDLSVNNRVIAIDLPGHGDSEMELENYSIEDMAGLIKEFLDKLELEEVTMFGHSLGGYITLAFCELYPQYLNGFSLVHSTANPDSEEAKAGRESNAKKVLEQGPEEFIKGLSTKLFSKDHTEMNAQDIKNTVEIGMSTSIDGLASALMAMKNRPDRNIVLKDTDMPVLLIAGEQDQIIPPEKTFTVKKENIEQRIIEGAGHMSMYEKPGELVKIMKDFLAKI
ncbi:alpha/beta fold hydrolase [Mesobacillus subterraneus]|uniref:alpha/beta fold hydrolase n=1 Tax=Mesobacillus subterraneus TaxID=285983 RepID=UPI0020408832|nr:alpha/beta fold hydrolase [Mesobacillus subterraneus]MCM3664155.1 alpha/beta fold hydrolase [Mesobacillus subterraneus]MCM3682183.1 alpha/beta fold hydrolase [Mesobacillus subterraneus]